MLARMIRTVTVGLALAALAGAVLIVRHPLLRSVVQDAVEIEVATVRAGLR